MRWRVLSPARLRCVPLNITRLGALPLVAAALVAGCGNHDSRSSAGGVGSDVATTLTEPGGTQPSFSLAPDRSIKICLSSSATDDDMQTVMDALTVPANSGVDLMAGIKQLIRSTPSSVTIAFAEDATTAQINAAIHNALAAGAKVGAAAAVTCP